MCTHSYSYFLPNLQEYRKKRSKNKYIFVVSISNIQCFIVIVIYFDIIYYCQVDPLPHYITDGLVPGSG